MIKHKFKSISEELEYLLSWRSGWSDGSKYLLALTDKSSQAIIDKASYVGTIEQLLFWVKSFPNHVGTVYVDSVPVPYISLMQKMRPGLIFEKLELSSS